MIDILWIDIFTEQISKLLACNDSVKKRNIILFGVNGYVENICTSAKNCNLDISAILDNDINKQGSIRYGIKVTSIEEIIKNYPNPFFLIASSYYEEMTKQLRQYGYKKNVDFYDILNKYELNFLGEYEYYCMTNRAKQGITILEKFNDLYGKDAFFIVSPRTSIGDPYWVCRYIKIWMKKNNIYNYVYIGTGKSSYDMVRSFSLSNVEYITNSEMDNLVCALSLPFNIFRAVIVDIWIPHTNIISYFIRPMKLNQIDCWKRYVYDLSESTEGEPNIEPVIDVDKLYPDLVRGNSVIIAPYAVSLPLVNNIFWLNVVKIYQNSGIGVYTNVNGKEQAIEGTIPISFPLIHARQVLEYAGFFIGLRSGLCDLIHTAKCKIIIIYPQIANDSYFFTSLNRYALYKNVYEYMLGESNDEVLKKIKKVIGETANDSYIWSE